MHPINAGNLAVQMYTLREAVGPGDRPENLPAVLEQVAAIGYRNVELAGTYGHTPAELRRILDDAGLRAVSSHVMLERVEGDALQEEIEAAQTLGLTFAGVPWTDERHPDAFRGLAERLNAAGKHFRDAGIGFFYHNHEFEFAETEGAEGTTPFDVLAERAEHYDFELDLYWAVKGGRPPADAFTAHPGRFPLVHVKDMAEDGSWADVGSGTMDFPGIFAHTATAGIRYFVVEHDHPADPLASIRASHTYLTA